MRYKTARLAALPVQARSKRAFYTAAGHNFVKHAVVMKHHFSTPVGQRPVYVGFPMLQHPKAAYVRRKVRGWLNGVIFHAANYGLKIHGFKRDFYAPGCGNTIKVSLRRTLHRLEHVSTNDV
jgi:hypothetical protein